MKLFVLLLLEYGPACVILFLWWRLWRHQRRVRQISDAAIRELHKATRVARTDPEQAEIHLARFHELRELREEEARK